MEEIKTFTLIDIYQGSHGIRELAGETMDNVKHG
jgi:hypothetical protein